MSNDRVHNDAVSKSLRALLLLASRESMRVTDLSRDLGVAVSTAHRLLGILRFHEFVEQDMRTRRYRLGPAAIRLGQRAGGQSLVAVAHPHLEQLCAEFNETVNLVVLDGPDALFVDGVESRQTVRVATRTGARIPAYATAGGKVLLAQLPPASVHARYPEDLRQVTSHTLPSLRALDRELQQVRELGYAVNLGEHLADVDAIGVPVEGPHGRALAAVTVAGPSSRWDRERLVGLAGRLQAIALDITRELQDPPPLPWGTPADPERVATTGVVARPLSRRAR
jgi:DNA-binding IclR family transcriptional regulator